MYEEEIHFGILLLKQSETVLTHLTWWPWPLTDVWTKFEEGRLRRFRVIDRKRKGYRRTDQQDRPTDRQVQSNMPFLLQRQA